MKDFISAKFVTTVDPEYHHTFWQSMKGMDVNDAYLASGKGQILRDKVKFKGITVALCNSEF